MQAQQCLFFQESNDCNDVATDEHIIQRGLAGTLSSSKIICANCNNFFSHNLDSQLIKFYEPIIYNNLSPLIDGQLKKKKIKTKLTSGELGGRNIDLDYIGGIANFSRISKIYSPKGHLKKIIAPISTSQTVLDAITKSEEVKIKSYKKIPFTECFPDGRVDICWDINSFLIRAILLDILELADHVSFIENLPNIARHRCLHELRLWIRKGYSSNRFPPKDIFFAFAPISDLLDPLFEPSIFSHRLVICFDHKSKVLILVAQFVNTMPWVFILEDMALHSCSISILYKKALIGGEDQLTSENRTVLEIGDIRWRKFSTTTPHALEFAKTKWKQEFIKQMARAYYEFDLRQDEFIAKKLAGYANDYHGKDAPVNAIVKLMQTRYQESQYIKDILEMTKKTASEMLINTPFSSNQKNQKLLFIYRECLKNIKNNFGYPVFMEV